MRLWERLSGIIFRLLTRPYLKTFEEKSPEKILRRSLKLLDHATIQSLKDYIRSSQTASGGFEDKAGRPDLYYTLFGYLLAYALDLNELLPAIANYTENEIVRDDLDNVHLHCAAILSSQLHRDPVLHKILKKRIRQSLLSQLNRQHSYNYFISLLACYYMRDFKGLFFIKKYLSSLKVNDDLPSPVIASMLVLQHSFNKPVNDLEKRLLSFHCKSGGFKATQAAPITDMLSTAVSLYALGFAGSDIRRIKPDSLNYIDSLYIDGGFSGNEFDQEADIEYTFYGLLALGSLAG